jgi:hypothetical protein
MYVVPGPVEQEKFFKVCRGNQKLWLHSAWGVQPILAKHARFLRNSSLRIFGMHEGRMRVWWSGTYVEP